MSSLGRLLVASIVLGPLGGSAHHKTEQGNRAYLAEDYPEALRSYTEAQVTDPQAAELYYNIGNVLYRQGDFEGATEAYTRALLAAPGELVSKAAYNLGNAQFEQKHYPQAIEAFERVLRSDAGDVEAKRNLELAVRAREFEQQQKEQQDQGDGKQEPQQGQEPEEGGDSRSEPNVGPEEPQTDSEHERRGRQNERESASEEPGDSSGAGEETQGTGAEGAPGQLTEDQTDQILAGLEEQEKQNLREKVLQKIPARGRSAEKDW